MKAVLQEILDRTPGVVGAAVVGADGIAVEKVSTDAAINLDVVTAEGMHVVKRAAGMTGGRHPAGVEEISVTGGAGLLVLRSLGSEYYLCIVARPECIPGQVRYQAWRAGHRLQAALA
jgi:predicted regulator of Ras-like GTPase activity (Roadblock/LC7/MglB family)